MNGRVARGAHIAEASRVLPKKRGERFCDAQTHDTTAIRSGEPCPKCGAAK